MVSAHRGSSAAGLRAPAHATRTFAALALSALALACAPVLPAGSGGPIASGATTDDLVVYAASSLGTVLHDLASMYEAQHSAVRIVLATDSSSALRTRIEQGAPADVFAAADTDNPARLARAGLTSGPPVSFARNRLAIVVPSDNPARIRVATDLARPGVRMVAAADGVPITGYAAELLRRLAGLPGAPPDLVARVERNIVSREDNVSAVLAKVRLGEADAGIVYATDVRATGDVRSISVPDAANVDAVYAAVAVARNPPARTRANDFVQWLRSPAAQAVLAAAGFLPPP